MMLLPVPERRYHIIIHLVDCSDKSNSLQYWHFSKPNTVLMFRVWMGGSVCWASVIIALLRYIRTPVHGYFLHRGGKLLLVVPIKCARRAIAWADDLLPCLQTMLTMSTCPIQSSEPMAQKKVSHLHCPTFNFNFIDCGPTLWTDKRRFLSQLSTLGGGGGD